MWIFCLFLFNTFVFVTTFVFFSETKVAFFFCLVFSLRRAIGGLPRKEAKLFTPRFALRSSTNPCALSCARSSALFPYGAPRKKGYGDAVSELRFSVLSLSLYLPNSFLVFSAFQWFCNIRRAIRRLAPQGGKALHSALRAPLEHESLRAVVREVFAYIYGAPKSPRFRRGLLARHKELESLTFGSVDQRSIQLS